MMLRKFLVTIIATLCFSGSAHAQTPPQSPNQTGLVLEVVYLKGRLPAYQPVAASRVKRGGAWYGLFGRIAGWQLPNGALPIKAIRLVPYLKGDTINLNVTVLRGEFLDAEDRVASYQVRENEAVIVVELGGFGVEPFAIRVIRSPGNNSDMPTTLNKTKSVAVVGLEPLIATLPRYKLTLRNLSDKNIIALGVKVMVPGGERLSSIPSANYGEPLIKAHDSADLIQSLAVNPKATPAGYEPSAPSAQQIVVESLVFEDGSYEGELKPASSYLGFVVGRRIELKRILPLLDNAALASDALSASDTLRAEIESLTYEPDEAEVGFLAAAFPSLDKSQLRTSVQVAIHGLRKDLLDQLDRLQKPKSNAGDWSEWLVHTRQLYSEWLAKLNAVNVSQR